MNAYMHYLLDIYTLSCWKASLKTAYTCAYYNFRDPHFRENFLFAKTFRENFRLALGRPCRPIMWEERPPICHVDTVLDTEVMTLHRLESLTIKRRASGLHKLGHRI